MHSYEDANADPCPRLWWRHVPRFEADNVIWSPASPQPQHTGQSADLCIPCWICSATLTVCPFPQQNAKSPIQLANIDAIAGRVLAKLKGVESIPLDFTRNQVSRSGVSR